MSDTGWTFMLWDDALGCNTGFHKWRLNSEESEQRKDFYIVFTLYEKWRIFCNNSRRVPSKIEFAPSPGYFPAPKLAHASVWNAFIRFAFRNRTNYRVLRRRTSRLTAIKKRRIKHNGFLYWREDPTFIFH